MREIPTAPVLLLVCDLEEGPIKQLQALLWLICFFTDDVEMEELPLASSLHHPSTHVHNIFAHLLGPAQLAGTTPPEAVSDCTSLCEHLHVSQGQRERVASSQRLLCTLGTHRLERGDRAINCGHYPVLCGKSVTSES